MINLEPAGFKWVRVFVPGNLCRGPRPDTLTNDLNLLQRRDWLISPEKGNLQRTNCKEKRKPYNIIFLVVKVII